MAQRMARMPGGMLFHFLAEVSCPSAGYPLLAGLKNALPYPS
jgi:hypothetical protein